MREVILCHTAEAVVHTAADPTEDRTAVTEEAADRDPEHLIPIFPDQRDTENTIITEEMTNTSIQMSHPERMVFRVLF